MLRPIILTSCVVKKDNKYLLVQEADDKVYAGVNTHSKGKWTLPHGKLDPNEDLQLAAERELLEETGGKTEIKRLGAIALGKLENTIYLISFNFYGEGFEGIKERATDEIGNVQWFTKEETKRLEEKGLVRDNVPISKIIQMIEEDKGVSFVDWPQPEHVKEIFRLLGK